MIRNISLDEISDGKLYELNDMVKADCNGCVGCFSCCQGMGNSIVLDPLDIYNLTKNLNKSMDELLKDRLELNVVDGLILPNLKMSGNEETCAFLNNEGRCSIHEFRPGICRLFPLGRYYENQSFKYFLQVHECKKSNKTKVKVRKWIDTPDIKENEQFIIDWHYFLINVQDKIKQVPNRAKDINMYTLGTFFIKQYNYDLDFYTQFYDRLNEAKSIIASVA